MGILNIFRHRSESKARPRAEAQGQTFTGMDDPALLEYIRTGQIGGPCALRNMATLRCVSLICESIGMLPLNLIASDSTKAPQSHNPAYRLLKLRPNGWQTPYEFKSLMQSRVLEFGNAYAQVIRSAGRPVALVPLDDGVVEPTLVDTRMRYSVTTSAGTRLLGSQDVLHLKDLSADGIVGMSRMRLAADAIALARDAERAAQNVFRTGNMAAGAIETPNALSDTAYDRMQKSMRERYSGVDNAGKLMLLEEGAKLNASGTTAKDSQGIENRNTQIEEVARAFGVPRPLLMMDDTSWGSGIAQLGIFFIQYGLQHWFTAWEQAASRALLTDADLDRMQFKFNARALMRGTFGDQAAYLAQALGAGGTKPWMTVNEARDVQDLPASDDPEAGDLRNPMTQEATGHEPDPTS